MGKYIGVKGEAVKGYCFHNEQVISDIEDIRYFGNKIKEDER